MTYIYCRISTDKQSDESLERQEEICRKWVSEPITVVHEIGSGNNQNRPELQKILRQLQPDDYVCIRDNSRLARNMLGSLTILNTITEKGAHLICDGKVIEPDNPQDIFTFNVHSAFSDFQRSIQADKSREGIKKVYDSGDYVFCSTLFGYSLTRSGKNKIVTVIEEEAKIVRFVFEKFSSGWSLKKILQELQGLPLNRQSNFTLKKLSRILKQTIYMGYYVSNKDKTEDLSRCSRSTLEGLLIKSNMYSPIIEESLFWDCWERYREVRPTHSRPWELRWTKHTLSGIIRCPDCGKGISRFDREGGLYATEDHSPDCPSKCRSKYPSDWLEKIMELSFYVTFSIGSEVGQFFSQKQQELYQNKTEIGDAIQNIDRSISETQTKIDRIVSAIASGVITNEQASKQMSELNQTISQLQDRKLSLEQDLRQVEIDVDSLIELSSEEVRDSFYNHRRDYFRKFLKEGLLYKNCIIITYMNGREFVIPRPKRHNHKIDDVTIITKYEDDSFQFVYNLNGPKLIDSGTEVYDNYVRDILNKSWKETTDGDT